jgi:hypothetical protein
MLEELQSLSETNKKRVLVIATTIIMVIVIGIWFSSFSSLLGAAAGPQAAVQSTSSVDSAPAAAPLIAPATAPAQANGPSLWQNIKNGFGGIENIFRKPSQYNITPQGN